METLNTWWAKAKVAALTHWVWVVTIASITLLAISPLIGNAEAKKIVQTISSVILASGVAGAVIRSSTFTEMFIARIVDVFYDGKHLRSRKDLAEICTRTLNALLESESTVLRGAVGNELLTAYLDFKNGYVYKDFRVQIQVLKVHDDRGLIEVLETVRATVIPNTGRKNIEIVWTWSSPNTRLASARLLQLYVDGQEIPAAEIAPTEKNGMLRSSYTFELDKIANQDEVRSFELVRRVQKVIEVRADPISTYKLSVPALDMSIELSNFPEDKLTAELQSFGMPRQFTPDRKDSDRAGHWRSTRYSGLIFPKQGAILQWFLK